MLLGLLAAVGLAGAGCKKDEKDGDKSEKSEKSDKDKGEKKSGKFACCDGSKTFGSCKQYNEGNLEIGEEPLRKLCDAVKGTFKPEKCPAENRVGVCTKPEGTDVYYSGTEVPNDVVKLEKYCTEGGGKWSK
jgi:hypothetical protein